MKEQWERDYELLKFALRSVVSKRVSTFDDLLRWLLELLLVFALEGDLLSTLLALVFGVVATIGEFCCMSCRACARWISDRRAWSFRGSPAIMTVDCLAPSPFERMSSRCRPKKPFWTRPVASFDRAFATFLDVSLFQSQRIEAIYISTWQTFYRPYSLLLPSGMTSGRGWTRSERRVASRVSGSWLCHRCQASGIVFSD